MSDDPRESSSSVSFRAPGTSPAKSSLAAPLAHDIAALRDLDLAAVTADEIVALYRVLDFVEQIPPDRLDPWHTVTVKADAWHMAHPVTCDLAACPFDAAARQWQAAPLAAGTYRWHELLSSMERTG